MPLAIASSTLQGVDEEFILPCFRIGKDRILSRAVTTYTARADFATMIGETRKHLSPNPILGLLKNALTIPASNHLGSLTCGGAIPLKCGDCGDQYSVTYFLRIEPAE